MLKKLGSALMLFVFCSCTLVSAMFFDDNPRYIQVGHDALTESYIDMTSISPIRYDPPYYVIRATVLTFDFSTNTATGYEDNFFYDFNSQAVKTQTLSTTTYDDKGPPRAQVVNPDPEVVSSERYSVNGNAADKAFFNCYNMTFYHSFNKDNANKNK